MKILLPLLLLSLIFFWSPQPAFASPQAFDPTQKFLIRTPEFYVNLMTFIIIVYIITSLWALTKNLGAFFTRAVKPFMIGMLILSIETIDKMLAYFHIDFVAALLTQTGEQYFHDLLKLLGLLFVAYGIYKVSQLLRRHKKHFPKN